MPDRVEQRGPVHDNALRWLAVHDLVTLCRWIGVEADEGSVRISESLPAATQYADLVIEVAPGQLAQVEFVTTVESDLPVRMHEYRSRLMRRQPGWRLRQHVVVLGRGEVLETHGDEDHWYRLFVTYLRDQDPKELLSHPSLAPLAVLARAASPAERAALLAEALEVIKDREPDETRRSDLIDTAASLARIRLQRPTIVELLGKESAMPIDIDPEELAWVRGVRKQAERDALLQFVEANDPVHKGVLAILRHRFGDQERLEDLAWYITIKDVASAHERALEAKDLGELMASYWPEHDS